MGYQKRLRQIIELARKENKTLPIYITGIYNPFYLNFPEMTEMQTIVDNWNRSTEEVSKEYDNVYFVPVNDLLYKGINGKGGVTSSDETSQSTKSSQDSLNDALFEEDHFHPNNTGYQIMSDAILKRINQKRRSGQVSKVWKWLFLGLLALNLALISVVTVRIMTPVEMSPVSLPKGAAKIGKYSMSKEELDASLRGFAQDYSTDKMRFKVKVTNSKIVFESSYKVLGHAVPLYVYFTPLVSESGAVVLQVSELSAGTLKLPILDALNMIKRSTKLPDYIVIDSKKGKVILNIQSMKNDKGITARAQSFDLVNDRIEFDIYKTIN